MTSFNRLAVSALVGASLTASTGVFAQAKPGVELNITTRSGQKTLDSVGVFEPVVKGLPYSGEGITTVKLTMFDGTKVERTVTAKLSRDSAGRVRREQAVVGLEALDLARGASGVDVHSACGLHDPGFGGRSLGICPETLGL